MEYEDRCFIELLEKELIPALGCTEPIALAYAAAYARDVLETIPDKAEIIVSNNIIKNVKSVTIPNTNGLRGIESAVVAGIIGGKVEKRLEVIEDMTCEQINDIIKYLQNASIHVRASKSEEVFEIDVREWSGKDCAEVKIIKEHMNVVLVKKNDTVIYKKENHLEEEKGEEFLSIENIIKFADNVPFQNIEFLIHRQVKYNMKIAEEGIKQEYGGAVGKTILSCANGSVREKARAYAAAGSDARMNGCTLPVVIVSGSGNQGITASVPIIVYAREKGYDEERMIRAIVISDLLTIYQRQFIGRLSAYCGAVNAGCASVAGISYLEGGGFKEVAHTLVNSLAAVSGIICDGAKSSCAAKIASAIDAGFLGYTMYQNHKEFVGGDGIVTCDADETVKNVGILGREGMRQTDQKIIDIMLKRTVNKNRNKNSVL